VKRLHRKTLFEDESGTQSDGPRTAHREIVHGTFDREVADGSTGEDKWLHDIGISRHGKPCAANRE
jgi:hypothetical protein